MYNDDNFEQSGNPLKSLIKTAIGLSPVAYAGYKMAGHIKANAALNPAVPLGVGNKSTGNLGDVGAGIGAVLARGSRDSHAADQQRLKALTDSIMKADSVQKIFQATGEQNALIQSLLETMDDPTNGLGNQLLGYKERLMDLARENSDPDQLRDVIQTVVRAIDSGQMNESAKVRWERNSREYRKLGPQLTPPSTKLTAHQPFTHVEPSSLSGLAGENYNKIVGRLGVGGRNKVSVIKRQFNGIDQFYARVYSGGVGRSSYLDTLPLQISGGNGPVLPLFMGENLQTAYSSPRSFIHAEHASNILNRNPNAGFSELMAPISHGGASIGVENFIIDEFLNRMKSEGGHSYMSSTVAKGFREWKREYMADVMPRIGYSIENAGVSHHLNHALGQGSSRATVVNFGKMKSEQQLELMTRLGTTAGFEAHAPGYQMMVKGVDDEAIGRIGLYQGSALQSLKSVVSANRGHFPVESRIEQVWGRTSMFVQNKARRMGRGGALSAGAQAITKGSAVTHLGENIEWAASLTGATNKAVVLDVAEGSSVWSGLGGQGVALSTGRERVRSFASKPILDPGSKGYMASTLFEQEILGRAKPGEMISLSAAQIEKHAGFLGIGSEGLQFLRDDPRAMNMHVAYNMTEASGKKIVNIMTSMDRRMEYYKGFSMMHKGLIENVSNSKFWNVMGSMGFSRHQMKALNLSSRDIVIAPGDMLKKGTGFFDLQMRSGYGLVAGQNNYETVLNQLAQTQHYAKLGNSELARTTGAVIKGLSERVHSGHTTAAEAGHVLAAIYTRGFSGTKRIGGKKYKGFIEGINAEQAINHAGLGAAIKQAFGKHAAGVIATARSGRALAASSITQGEGPGDWALGRGSVEPRFIKNLQHRLGTMGFDRNAVSEIIGSVYKRKIGFAQHIKAARGLDRMAESLTGSAGVLEGASQVLGNVRTYGLDDVGVLSAAIAKGGFGEVVAQNPNGFILDLTKGANTVGGHAIASAAREYFGQGQVFFPGSEVTQAMKDTFIKGEMGNIQVEGRYSGMAGGFIEDVAALTSQHTDVAANASRVMSGFKGKAIDLYSQTWMGVARGKIKGMQSHVARLYDLDTGNIFNTQGQRNMAIRINKRAKGYAAFMDKKAFLSQMNDWMGTDPGSSTLHDAAKKAEMFFLSPEEAMRTGKIGKAKGVVGLGTRHPELSLGNITPLQFFRDVREVGRGDRDVFGMMNRLGHGVNSWGDVQALSSAKRHSFFYDFVQNVGNIAPEGGGGVFLPRTVADVTIGGRKDTLKVDMGVAGAAIGDFDGDQWMTLFTDAKTGKHLMSTMKAGKREAWLKADAIYKVKGELYAEEAKDALKRHVGGDVEFLSKERIREGLMKENAAKEFVGSLDTRLTKLRTALLDMHMSNPAERAKVDEALALLKVVQEHAVIKAKKLPVYLPFAQDLTKSIDWMFNKGDFSSFDTVMREKILKGSKLLDEDMMIQGVDSPFLHTRTISNEKVSFNDTMGVIKEAAERARISGNVDMPTHNWIAKVLKEGSPEEVSRARAILNAGTTLEGGMIHAFEPITGKAIAAGAENMFRKVATHMGALDRGLMGVAAAGIAGSVAVMGLLNHQGYAPTPLTVPGEAIDPSVRRSISEGGLFNAQNPVNAGMGLMPGNMMDRPISTPSTYLKASNSYQLRGNVPNTGGVASLGNYMGSIGSNMSANIRINDTRAPITQNYVDRLSGMY